jgi:hypothetical protein
MNERPIPDAALDDDNAVEMLRVWIAKKKLHCSMKVGMYKEAGGGVSEEKAWGIVLADTARHIARALESGYSENASEVIRKIRESFEKELNRPTSSLEGGFVNK